MLIQPPHVVIRWFAIALLIAGFLVIFKYITVGHATEVDWRARAEACFHQGETDPAVCPGHPTSCPGWPWITRCVANQSKASAEQLLYLDSWCIPKTNQQREHERAPASTGGTAIAQALECARIIQ